ncbi:formiminoglutamase [Halovenus aranensis]|jgi:formiminoglutamase/agmatinase|uniref:Formimidoylglutamase n=1 Tax=Halovenus aranensis TaxID=890420 RepID=A0A1G8S925_9EURY|nr:formimidoylglutamase [Halovenus aranensis]SDJ25716.1 formiminoglutamase [Halovenus aranensis]
MDRDPEFEMASGWRGPSADPHDEQLGDNIEPTTPDSADTYDAVLVGEPYDGAVIGSPGAREGPAAIRDALAGVKTHHFDAGPIRAIGDLGTVDIPTGASVSDVQAAVRAATETVHEQETIPIFLGGDNSLTYPNAGPLLDREETVGVVSLDAHLDCRAVRGEPSSGAPYRQLWEAGLDEMAVLGARHFETSTVYAEYLREQGGEVVTAEEVGDDPVEATDRALAAVETDHLYVSVDIDVLDATAAPGVSAPTPGGITTRELFRLVRLLASVDRLAGFEVVETAPPLCPDGRTADAAARTVAHVLSVLGGEPA